ncbi:MAG: nucleotidyltransferase domain-containing protein [Sedimentisphaerales bacterium]|nr:nucleotidyltransferase domain-containing protein [Sedimentisphaerales bacterium]
MVTSRRQAQEIASKVRQGLEKLYGPRLRRVYLYGSGARDELTPDSDIDIAVVLDDIPSCSDEHRRVSRLGADLSLEFGTVVLFFFASEADFAAGRFAIHRAIRDEGIAA